MADEKHLSMLKQYPKAWNQWREGHQTVWVDLREADLKRANLHGRYLDAANLTRADCSGADFSEADLTNAKLDGTTLGEADLTDAIFTGTHLPPGTTLP